MTRLVRFVKDEGWDKEIEHLGEEEFSQKMYEVPGVKQAAKSEEEGKCLFLQRSPSAYKLA